MSEAARVPPGPSFMRIAHRIYEQSILAEPACSISPDHTRDFTAISPPAIVP